MKKKNVKQEVLVRTETSVAQNALIKHNGYNKKTPSAEDMEEGLWNGLLNEMLPELVTPMEGRKSQYFIWQITSTREFFMLIDMGETYGTVEDSNSINPNLFLSIPKMN